MARPYLLLDEALIPDSDQMRTAEAKLAAETDEKKFHEILTTEIRNALNGIADSLTNGN